MVKPFHFIVLFLSISSAEAGVISNLCDWVFDQFNLKPFSKVTTREKEIMLDKNFLYRKHGENINNVTPANHFLYSALMQKEMAIYYTGAGHQSINSELAKRDFLSMHPEAPKKEFLVNEYLSHQKKFEGTVYSGARVDLSTYKGWNIEKDKEFIVPYFFSSSRSEMIAEKFSGVKTIGIDPKKMSVIFVVESKNGVSVENISKHQLEDEVLFKTNNRFMVTNIEDKIYQVGDTKSTAKIVTMKDLSQVPTLKDISSFKFSLNKKLERSRFVSDKEISEFNIENDSIDKWFNGAKYVNELDPSAEINADILKKINQIVYEDTYFFGYESRRIRDDFVSGKISETEALELLAKNRNEVKYSSVNNEDLIGQFRKEHFFENGDHFDEHGHRYFTDDDLMKLSKNPLFKIDYLSLKKNYNGNYYGEVYYLDHLLVEQTVNDSIKYAKKFLDEAQSNEDYIREVLKLQQTLMSIHPFYDGNGRTIRLFSDYLYKRRGIPPPIKPVANDYYLSIDELYAQTIININAHLDLIK